MFIKSIRRNRNNYINTKYKKILRNSYILIQLYNFFTYHMLPSVVGKKLKILENIQIQARLKKFF